MIVIHDRNPITYPLLSLPLPMSFTFPQIHAFPPFYTRQLHEETWRKQKDLWIETILGYCAAKRIFEINLDGEETYQLPLFNNTSIDRNY